MKSKVLVGLLASFIAFGSLSMAPWGTPQVLAQAGNSDLTDKRICPKCGCINDKDVRFCKDCGYNFAAAMQGQSQTQGKGPKKEPVVAWALSFFLLPGLGQFYNGEGGKGAGMLLAYGGATALWILNIPSEESYYYGSGYYGTTTHGNTALFWTGLGICCADAIWSWVDAPISASRINRERGYTLKPSPRLNLTLTPDPRNHRKMNPGVSLTKRF